MGVDGGLMGEDFNGEVANAVTDGTEDGGSKLGSTGWLLQGQLVGL